MRKKVLTVLLLLVCAIAFGQSQRLYKIINQKKFGFIDATGTIKIPAKFNFAKQFKEGLAAVRENDKYGYIDEQGNYVIQPQYEMAESFSSGLAVVYTNGKPFVINKQNKKIVDTFYHTIESYNNGFAHVSSAEELWGVIDSLGNEVIKPMLADRIRFEDDYVIVRKPVDKDFSDFKHSAINKNYQFVFPLGKYSDIEYYGNDMFLVQDQGVYHLINKQGKEILADDKRFDYHLITHFSNGLAIVNITEKLPSNKTLTYSAIVDTSGTILFKDNLAYEEATEFNNNVAFIKLKGTPYWAIDKNGVKKFVDVIQSIKVEKNIGFTYGNRNDMYGLYGFIDTNGKIVIKARFSWCYYGEDIGKFCFQGDSKSSGFKNGFFDAKGNIQYVKNNELDYVAGLSKKELTWHHNNNTKTYELLDSNQNKVWQIAPFKDSITHLNIDFFYRAKYEQKEQSYNFKDQFYNFGTKQKSFPFNNEKDKLSLKILNNVTDTFINAYYSHPLYVLNNTKKDITYLSLDFEAPIILQAKNQKGEWQDIAPIKIYHGHNTNTYMRSTLSPNNYLKFSIPIFQGAFKTKLRVAFEYNIRDDKKYYYEWETKTLYSNEIDVSINPSQFYYEPFLHPLDAYIESYWEILMQ